MGRGWRSSGAGWVLPGVLCCGVWGQGAWAQLRARPLAYAGVDAQGNVTTMPAALRTMAAQADVVFLGTVQAVTRVGSDGGSGGMGGGGAMEVRFGVEQAVRGVSGTSYTMREWDGLWPAGEQRYVVGERRLMLLHRPSALGLSSPVGGMEGAIPVRGEAPRVSKTSVTTQKAEGVADLRWIAAKLARPVRYAATAPVRAHAMPGPTAAGEMAEASADRGRALVEGESSPSLVHGVIRGQPGGRLPVTVQSAVAEGAAMPVADLLTWLRGWQAEEWGDR